MTTAAEKAADAIVLDLDALERDDPAKDKPPFTFILKGRKITLIDPVEIDWQVLIEMSSNPATFAVAAMSRADRKFFESHKVETWKVDRLIGDYQEYYDIEEPGKAD